LFVFDDEHSLVALPVSKRQKPSLEDRWSRSSTPQLTAARYLAEVLSEPEKHSDPNNVPLSEAEENRLAWLGVELQTLTPDLARINGIADQTNDGATGALVTHVYP